MSKIMSNELGNKYPHLIFQRNWDFSETTNRLLGQCEAFTKAICNTPLLPEDHKILYNVALVKGAQATTAIEGNTLSENEITDLQKGFKLPPSKKYLEQEVVNVLDAYDKLVDQVISQNKRERITPELICRFHQYISKDLGEHLDAIPGKFRTDNRVVGTYRCPDYEDVPELVENMCDWLIRQFNFSSGQHYIDYVVQAIISHVYLEWIHPFGDGNGRTGRLLEYYILLRGGNPAIASHIMANHYNLTRSEYYRQLDICRQKRSLSGFIEYALEGLRDGLEEVLRIIQRSQYTITWQKHIYDAFSDVKMSHKDVFKRRRSLILEMPLDRGVSLLEIPLISTKIARMFSSLSDKTVQRDIFELKKMGLLVKDKDLYFANTETINRLRVKKHGNEPF